MASTRSRKSRKRRPCQSGPGASLGIQCLKKGPASVERRARVKWDSPRPRRNRVRWSLRLSASAGAAHRRAPPWVSRRHRFRLKVRRRYLRALGRRRLLRQDHSPALRLRQRPRKSLLSAGQWEGGWGLRRPHRSDSAAARPTMPQARRQPHRSARCRLGLVRR